MKDILIAGIAGSGKGTQARAILEKIGNKVQYFEPGSILRAFTSNDNIVGNFAKTFTSQGKLLPDDFMINVLGLVFASLHEENGLLIDGFPRMYGQKKMLDDAMEKYQRDFVVFHLALSEEQAKQRLLNRVICPTCGTTYSHLLTPGITHCPEDNVELIVRADDQSESAVAERFKLYHTDTKSIIDEYDTAGKVVHIDGSLGIDEITKEILEHIG